MAAVSAAAIHGPIAARREEGRVIERGTHPERLARGGAYARLSAAQFQESPAEMAR